MNDRNPLYDDAERLAQENGAADADTQAHCDEGERERRSRELDELFSSRINVYFDNGKKPDSPEASGWDYLVLKRRKTAILNLIAQAEQRFAQKYPALSVADQLMKMNAPLPAVSFETVNRKYAFELAAAIWILDDLKASGAADQAAPYLPDTREELDTVYLPMLSDSVHSDDELKAILYIIRNRSRGMSGCSGAVTFGDEADTHLRKEAGAEAPRDRKNFDAVMALTDQEKTAQAQDALIGLIWEHFGQLLSFVNERSDDEARAEALYNCLLTLPDYAAGTAADGEETFAALTIPAIRNPYEICFAFLSLLSEDSDCVWLYNLCLNILTFACQALPWADSDVVNPDPEGGEISIDYAYLSTLIEKKPDWNEDNVTEKLYEMCIPSPLLRNRRVRTSIAGLAFLASGLIPPRTCHSLSFTRALLNETEFAPETQDMIYHYFALAYSVNHKGEDFESTDGEQAAEEQTEEIDLLKDKDAEIKKLRAQIKHLKGVVNQSEHQNKGLTAELAAVRRQLDDTNTELAELRTMIRESCETQEETPTVINFPYTVQKRTVIIGGRDSWLKAIKPLLGNVRYIGPSEQPNPGVILNAEVVWFQANAMGHSSFYKVIDIVRKNAIKVCYFKYASAEKCAEQLALEEIGETQE